MAAETEHKKKDFWDEIESVFGNPDEIDNKEFELLQPLDNQLYKKKPPESLIGETVKRWLEGKKQEEPPPFMYKLVKKLIEKGANFVRSLKVESKESRVEILKFMLRLIVDGAPDKSNTDMQRSSQTANADIAPGESNTNIQTSSQTVHMYGAPDDGGESNERCSRSDEKKKQEFLAEAVKNPNFLDAICDLYKYNCLANKLSLETNNLDELQEMDTNLEVRRILANPHVRCLIYFLKESEYAFSDKESRGVLLEALQYSSELRDQKHTNGYLEAEHDKLSAQVEKFAVALVDEVKHGQELEQVMENGCNSRDAEQDSLLWTGEIMAKIVLLQEAVRLRCKSFVASKKCQYVMEKIVFGRFHFWNAEKSGISIILVLAIKCIAFPFVGIGIFLCLVLYICSLCCKPCKTRDCGSVSEDKKPLLPKTKSPESDGWCDYIFDWAKVPCQRYLFDLWCYVIFMSLIITTAKEENFGPDNKHLISGLTLPDLMVWIYAIDHVLCTDFPAFCRRVCFIRKHRKKPRTGSCLTCFNCCSCFDWRLIFPGVLSLVNFASSLLIVVAISMWVGQWNQHHTWEPRKKLFRDEDIVYSVASLLTFARLAHFYKAQQNIGKLVLSMSFMLIRDVVVFTFIFFTILFLPFAIGLRKMYSYYVADESRNATQPLATFEKTFDVLFWTMFGSDERQNLEVPNPEYKVIRNVGAALTGAFVVTTVLVAINMLIATMNQTYEEIMKDVDKEYVFVRTRMWFEYISDNTTLVPTPFKGLWIIIECIIMKCCCTKTEKPPENKRLAKKISNSLQKLLVIRYLWRSMSLKEDDETLEDTSPQQSPQTSSSHSPPKGSSVHWTSGLQYGSIDGTPSTSYGDEEEANSVELSIKSKAEKTAWFTKTKTVV